MHPQYLWQCLLQHLYALEQLCNIPITKNIHKQVEGKLKIFRGIRDIMKHIRVLCIDSKQMIKAQINTAHFPCPVITKKILNDRMRALDHRETQQTHTHHRAHTHVYPECI